MVKKQQVSGELGTTGLNRWGGVVTEEFLVELQGQRGRKVYDEMRSNDPIVGAILFAIEMALREVPWFVEPVASEEKDKKVAEFLHSCMYDMSHTWDDFISEVLLMLPYGYSWFEIVYKRRDGENSQYNDGLIGWRKFGYRAADTLYKWEFDDAGGIKAFVQMAPPDYKIVAVPIEKSILFRTRKDKNNPEGRSVLRNAYRPWYFKKNLETLEGISLERVYAGFPIIRLPPGASTGASAGTDEHKAKDIVRKIRVDEQMGIVLPQNWELEFKSGEGRGIDAYNTAIYRYRQEIMLTVMATFIALGIEKAGSYALAREARDFFQMALMGWLDNIKETLNQFAVPKLMQLNGFDLPYPRIAAGKVGQIDLDKLSNYIMRLASVGAVNMDEQLEKYLREAADLPPRLIQKVSKAEEGEDWHPQIKKRPVTLKEIRGAEEELERSVRSFFRRQADWIKDNWTKLTPSKTEIIKQKDWEDWELAFAREIEKSIGKAMQLGINVAQEEIPGVIVNWTLQNPAAQKFLRNHCLELAKDITQTTKEQIKESLLTGIKLGEGKEELAKRVGAILDDASTWRSRLIAQTETIRAYSEGSLQLYKAGNIKKKEWLNGQPGACDECKTLDGDIVDIDDTFKGGYSAPPAHPGCRCAIAGVVE